MKNEYRMFFVEYGTYTQGVQAGRIEIYKIDSEGKITGDIERDKIESIGTIVLPIEVWQKLRKKLDGFEF